MFIVLEGIDKVGKSSLARHLSEKFDLPIIKFSKPEKEAYMEYMEFLIKQDKPAILDRFYLGELAYGPVKRGGTELQHWRLRNVEMLLKMRDPFCVYAFTNEAEIYNNFTKEKEEYATDDDVPLILDRFKEEIEISPFKWNDFNYLNDGNYENIDRKVENWLSGIKGKLSQHQKLVGCRTLGDFNATTLFLGEVSNIELEQIKYKYINVGFANGPSAEMLYGALYQIGRPYNFAISNVKKAHGDCDIRAELSLPYLKTVVCLGNVAYQRLSEVDPQLLKGKKVKKAYHPAFAQRQNWTYDQYANHLKQLL